VMREQRDSSRASRAGAVPGVPLQGPSGLRLLVTNGATVFVLEVDTGDLQPVTGLPAGADRSTHVEPVGQDAVVVSRRDCRGSGPVPCDAVLIDELPAGLLAHLPSSAGGGPYSALISADGAFRRLPEVVDGSAGGDLVLSTVEPGKAVALTDLRGGGRHQLPWPSRLDDHVMGLVTGHPDGRLAAVGFYRARSGAVQTLDLWLLDLTTRRWQQLPDTPLRLGPSKPQLGWTADGRLLLLAGLAEDPAGVVALWRPGQPRIEARQVSLPAGRPEGGFRYVLW
jgi:hypothetical protein